MQEGYTENPSLKKTLKLIDSFSSKKIEIRRLQVVLTMTTRMMVNDRMKLQPKPPLSLIKKNMKTDEESKKYAYEISFRKVRLDS